MADKAFELHRTGWSGVRIFRLFADPFYRGPHTVYRRKGPEYVRGLIDHREGSR